MPADVEIVSDNIRAAQILYFSAALEEMRVFEVVDRLVDLFGRGLLPVGRGAAGSSLYQFWRRRSERLSVIERRGLYARVLGMGPGGSGDAPTPNRDFPDLWARFLSAVDAYARQLAAASTLTRNVPPPNQAEVRRTARDLAGNLSLHGHGLAHFAAGELKLDIQRIIPLLSDPEILRAFGARDMWQVVERVAASDLGGAVNTVRHRTRAQNGSVILAWLANHGNLLVRLRPVELLSVDRIRRKLKAAREKVTTDPTDYDLLNAVEQWLAVAGTSDDSVA